MADSSLLFFASNEGYSAAHMGMRAKYTKMHIRPRCCVPLQRPLPSCYHVVAQALATASERANKKERYWQEHERGRMGKEKEMGGKLGGAVEH